jgi:hypothetical protein
MTIKYDSEYDTGPVEKWWIYIFHHISDFTWIYPMFAVFMINNLGGPMFATKPPEPYDCKSKSIGT